VTTATPLPSAPSRDELQRRLSPGPDPLATQETAPPRSKRSPSAGDALATASEDAGATPLVTAAAAAAGPAPPPPLRSVARRAGRDQRQREPAGEETSLHGSLPWAHLARRGPSEGVP